VTSDPEPASNQSGPEPAIVCSVRTIRGSADLAEGARSVEILWAILHWLDERRLLDEDGVVVWADGSNGRVVAEGPRRLVKSMGQYTATQVPTRQEITGSDLFAQLGTTPLGVVRQLLADLPNYAPKDVLEGLTALERLLTA
jgi:hypothetical protein